MRVSVSVSSGLGGGARAVDEGVGDEGVTVGGVGVVRVRGEEREALAVEVDAQRRSAPG